MARYDQTIDDDGNIVREHRVVWERTHGMKIPKGYVIHHIDGNGHNNDPDNLILMSVSDHVKLHKSMKLMGIDPVDSTDPDVIKARALAAEYGRTHRDQINARERQRRKVDPNVRIRQAEYRQEHKEAHATHSRKYYATHREQCLAKDREYREEHKEEISARQKEYYVQNKSKVQSTLKRYEESHKEERKQRNAVYLKQHREERKAYMRALNGRKTLERLISTNAPAEQIEAVKAKIAEAEVEFKALKTARGVK
jgi:hypothetical protein